MKRVLIATLSTVMALGMAGCATSQEVITEATKAPESSVVLTEEQVDKQLGAGRDEAGDNLGATDIIQVSIGQFHGIEINDFAVTVAKTALWIAESQMMQETEELMQINLDFLPLKSYANIVEGNALRIDWGSVVDKAKLSYIMGNPPFVGKKEQTKIQKQELVDIFGKKVKGIGNLDYVTGWYRKAFDLLKDGKVKAAFVSTNSITQGEQVPIFWKELLELGVHINFAYSTFRWDSEASLKAHVHCVIIGFSCVEEKNKRLYSSDRVQLVDNINPYLVNAPTILIIVHALL